VHGLVVAGQHSVVIAVCLVCVQVWPVMGLDRCPVHAALRRPCAAPCQTTWEGCPCRKQP
jgi:hypothetical protein